jgi:hypothetical protein
MKEENTTSLHAGTAGASATSESSVPTNWKKKSDTPMGYSR